MQLTSKKLFQITALILVQTTLTSCVIGTFSPDDGNSRSVPRMATPKIIVTGGVQMDAPMDRPEVLSILRKHDFTILINTPRRVEARKKFNPPVYVDDARSGPLDVSEETVKFEFLDEGTKHNISLTGITR